MKTAAFLSNIEWSEDKPSIKVLVETSVSKEIRIAMQTGQFMKEHKAPFPIIVQVIQGNIKFGIKGEEIHLKNGDLVALEANVPHDLLAIEDSIVRLSLSKLDTAERVKNV